MKKVDNKVLTFKIFSLIDQNTKKMFANRFRINIILVLTIYMLPYLNSFSQIKDIKTQLSKLKNWRIIEFQTGTTDTTDNNNIIPDSEIHVVLKNKSDFSINCLSPILEFYPIEFKKAVEKRILNHLILRSSLYPPPPQTFSNATYYIVIWNLEDYNSYQCCDCQSLEIQLKKILELRPTKFTNQYDFLKTK